MLTLPLTLIILRTLALGLVGESLPLETNDKKRPTSVGRFHSWVEFCYRVIVSPGTRTHPSISTRALRLMIALTTVHSPFD